MIYVAEFFSGVGAQATALENLGIEHECETSEIWEPAIKAYNAIHNDTPNLGDISKIGCLERKYDLLTYSFPCQDLSIAGHQKGMAEGSGTRSSLLWEVGRLLEDAKGRGMLPEFLLMENVEAIVAEKNLPHLKRWIMKLNNLGYTSSYAVLNAKDFGVPQNRRRVFMVSSLSKGEFVFPEGTPLDKRLKDVLEKDVDESYYLSEERCSRYEQHPREIRHDSPSIVGYLGQETQHYSVYSDEGIAPTLAACDFKDPIKIEVVGDLHLEGTLEQHCRVHSVDGLSPTVTTVLESPIIIEDVIEYPTNTTLGYMEAQEGDGLVMNRPTKARGTVQPQTAPTLTTGNGCGTGVVVREQNDVEKKHKLRIRYLTERECWRLQGFDDERIDKAFEVTPSKAARYAMAGNSIAVPCLEAIFKGIFINDSFRPSTGRQTDLDRWFDC